jgi:hypothetical protein
VGHRPKTAISYAGTYVVGNAVLEWYLTGRHLSKQQMQHAYEQALSRGRDLTRRLADKRPKLKLKKPRLPKPGAALTKRKPRALVKGTTGQTCAECGKTSAADARFCQYCGHTFD